MLVEAFFVLSLLARYTYVTFSLEPQWIELPTGKLDLLPSRGEGRQPKIGDQRRNLSEQPSGNRDLGCLET
jgi:hypothetical protein